MEWHNKPDSRTNFTQQTSLIDFYTDVLTGYYCKVKKMQYYNCYKY